MGRKIPGRKHNKIKDPNVQRSNRFAKIKDKINNPPKKEDFQEMPKSVLRIMELKEEAKKIDLKVKAKKLELKEKRKKKKKGLVKPEEPKKLFDMKKALGREKPDRFIPVIKQNRKESDRHFRFRVDSVCNEVLKEIKFEKEFHVKVVRDDSGVVTDVTHIKKEKRSKKPKLADKRRERENKKVNAKEPIKEFQKRDTFEFGDIVHEPPKSLTTPGPKRKNETGDILKPGNRDLLLKQVLSKDKESKNGKPTKVEREKLEARRKLVVEAFRNSKRKI